MSRLPTVSGDANAWGSILNDFLSVAHNSNGSLKNLSINLKDYCKIDGTSDDSIGFTTAYTLASSLGMGLFHPGGTLVKGNDTLLPTVPIIGAGPGVSIFKLKNGANTDLFSANTGNINLSAAFGSGSSTGVTGWSMSGLTLDGNKANQSSGPSYPFRWYGYGEQLQNIEVINGFTGGILKDWHAATPNAQTGYWRNINAHDNNGIGIQVGGPTDMVWDRVDSHGNGSHSYHIAPNAGGLQTSNFHGWAPATGSSKVTWLIEAQISATNGEAEGSDTAQVVILANEVQWFGGRVFAGSGGGAGFQIGQTAGGTPYAGSINQSGGVTTAVLPTGCRIDTLITDITSSNGSLWFANDGGNFFDCVIYQTSGNYFTGNPISFLNINGHGLTPDGTQGKGGVFQFNISAFSAFVARDANGLDICNINTYPGSKSFSFPNGTSVIGYSDGYATVKYQLNPDGNGSIVSKGSLSTGQSATAPDPGASGTVNTAGIGVARVNPSGASRAGCILAVGTQAGQEVWVVNENSTNTISWATEATSHIAGEAGGTFVLNGKRGQKFVWDSSIALWVKAS